MVHRARPERGHPHRRRDRGRRRGRRDVDGRAGQGRLRRRSSRSSSTATRRIEKLARRRAEAAGEGAQLVVFPETFVPVYPSSAAGRARSPAGTSGARRTSSRGSRASRSSVPSDDDRRGSGAIAREHGVVARRRRERARARDDLQRAPRLTRRTATLALRHRKLMPTNHERLVWGLGDGERPRPRSRPRLGRVGGLICWENFMPLARVRALRVRASRSTSRRRPTTPRRWHDVDPAHRARVARVRRLLVLRLPARRRATPTTSPIADGPDLLGRGGSAIVAPNGEYLAGPLWDEEGSSSPTSTRTSSTPNGNASIPPATTRGRTCCASRSRR